jgi:hypothetical protein
LGLPACQPLPLLLDELPLLADPELPPDPELLADPELPPDPELLVEAVFPWDEPEPQATSSATAGTSKSRALVDGRIILSSR